MIKRISERRKQNLNKSFPWIKWNWKKATIKDPSCRLLEFVVFGKYRDYDVKFKSHTGDGSNSSLKVYIKKKFLYCFNPASQYLAPKIKINIDSKVWAFSWESRKTRREILQLNSWKGSYDAISKRLSELEKQVRDLDWIKKVTEAGEK